MKRHHLALVCGALLLLLIACFPPKFLASHLVFAAPPSQVSTVDSTAGNGSITVTWKNPASGDFSGTMIRYSTSSFPATTSDGTLAADVAGVADGTGTYTITGLTNETTYYISLFAHNATPEYSAAQSVQQIVMPAVFTENFQALTPGNIQGQNGWAVAGGVWNVVDVSGEKMLQSSNSTGGFNLYRALNGGNTAAYSNQMLRAEWKGSTITNPGVLFLRAQSSTADAAGYYIWQGSNTLTVGYKNAAGSTQVTLGSGAFTPIADTWYIYEFSVTNNAQGLPILTAYVWQKGTQKPQTPTVQVTDVFNRFPQGVFSVGKFSTSITSYDNIVYYGQIGLSDTAIVSKYQANELTWKNPSGVDYAGTIVRGSTAGFPTSPTDGNALADITGGAGGTSTFTHQNLTNDTKYFYTLFPYSSTNIFGTPTRLTQIPYSPITSETFDALTDGALAGQNGWTTGSNTWTVGVDGGINKVVTGTSGATYTTNKALNGSVDTQDQILSFQFKTDNAAGSTVGFSWLRHQPDGSGYLFWKNGTIWTISYFTAVPTPTITTLGTGDATKFPVLEANTWYNMEISAITNGNNEVQLSLFQWKDGFERPAIANIASTDTTNRFPTGNFALGRNNTAPTAVYDNIVFSGKLPGVSISTPAAAVSGAPDVATIAIEDDNGTFYIPFIQTSTTLSVSAIAGYVPAGGGLEFVLNEGEESERSFIDLTAPYGGSFTSLAKGSYQLDVYILESDGTTRSSEIDAHDTRTNIGIGDIISVIGDSITEGYGGNTNSQTVTSWLDVDPGLASTDNRNFPQYGAGVGAYKESFLSDLNNALTSYFGYPVFIMNEGRGAIRAETYMSSVMLTGWQNRELALAPNTWLITLGNNDASFSRTAEQYTTDLGNIILALKNTYNAESANIYVANPFYDLRRSGANNTIINTQYIPALTALRADQEVQTGPNFFAVFSDKTPTEYVDEVHPNPTGYERIAKLWTYTLMQPHLTSSSVTGRQIALTWNDLGVYQPAITKYRIRYGTNPNDLSSSFIVTNTTSATLYNLAWNTQYYVEVTGMDNEPTATLTKSSTISTFTTQNGTSEITASSITGTATEAGGAATFTVVLNNQPGSDVTIPVLSNDTGEGVASPNALIFTRDNWNTPQTVTVTGVDDNINDGDQTYTIALGAATSSDITFHGFDAIDPSVTTSDNDTPAISTSASPATTTEAGGTATISVTLACQPLASVTIPIASSNTNEGSIGTSELTFTPEAWNTPQTITVTGVDDARDDGNQNYTVNFGTSISTDPEFNGLTTTTSLTNTDNDTAEILVNLTTGTTSENGTSALFNFTLGSQPTENVTVTFTSTNTLEGTISPETLTFTPDDWNTNHTLTVTGVNDDNIDGNIAFSITASPAFSADASYTNTQAPALTLTNIDNDSAQVLITQSGGSTSVNEGSSDTVAFTLSAQPTEDVTLSLANTLNLTQSTSTLTFTAFNWNTPQEIALTQENDAIAKGTRTGSLQVTVTSADPLFNNIEVIDTAFNALDNDTAAITASSLSGQLTEEGGTATFTLVLTSQPTASVSIPLSCSLEGKCSVSPTSVTFTTENWNSPQTITATGINDLVDNGNSTAITIIIGESTSSDPNYVLNPEDITTSVTDNDTAAITKSETGDNTQVTELGEGDAITYVLTTQPTHSVTLTLSFEGSDIILSSESLTFTTENWNTPQQVDIVAQDDLAYEGNETLILQATTASDDAAYNGLSAQNITVTITDNDTRRSGSSKTQAPTAPPTRAVRTLFPYPGQEISGGSIFDIRWTSEGYVPFVNLLLSTDNGTTWTTIATNVTNTGTYHFSVPQIATESAVIRLQSSDDATNEAIGHTSGAFTIRSLQPPTIQTPNDTTTPPPTDTASGETPEETITLPENITIHELIKLPDDHNPETTFDSTVYYISPAGTRHAFPDEDIFKTWYCNGAEITEVTSEALNTIPLGVNITNRPGTGLVKFASDTRVYAIDVHGVLRWMISEEIAKALYGENWILSIDEVPDTLLTSFTFGMPIVDLAQFDKDAATASATYPSDVLPPESNTPTFTITCKNAQEYTLFKNMQNALTKLKDLPMAVATFFKEER